MTTDVKKFLEAEKKFYKNQKKYLQNCIKTHDFSDQPWGKTLLSARLAVCIKHLEYFENKSIKK